MATLVGSLMTPLWLLSALLHLVNSTGEWGSACSFPWRACDSKAQAGYSVSTERTAKGTRDKNGERRDLNPGQRAAIRLSIDGKKEAERAKEEANRKRGDAANARRGDGQASQCGFK